MTSEKEKDELRDTLAVAITSELCRRDDITVDTDALRNVYAMADAVLSGRPNQPQQWYAPTRCQICGWPLAESEAEGCVPKNCSFRSFGPEMKAIRERRLWIAAQPEGLVVLGSVARDELRVHDARFSSSDLEGCQQTKEPTPLTDTIAAHRSASSTKATEETN